MSKCIESNVLDMVVVGEAPLDVILDTRPPTTRPGGAMYSACAAAAVGAGVGVVSDVGSDEIDGLLPLVEDMSIDVQGIRHLDTVGLRYFIRNADEVIPQVVTRWGHRRVVTHPGSFPPEYSNARCLLLYPYDLDLLSRIAQSVRCAGGKAFFDLQHDVTDLADWRQVIDQCDVVFASRDELLGYTDGNTEREGVRSLRDLGAKIVVVKYGMGGSAIYTDATTPILVPAYLASFKCTIGAGDVYNAIFALEYASGVDLKEAGSRAAIAAAVFSEHLEFDAYTQALSQLHFEREIRRRTPISAHPEQIARIQIYLAGHFLSTPMRMWVDTATLALESRGFSVFSPYRDVGVLAHAADFERRDSCFRDDLKGLQESQVVVALLDGLGRGGTSWEMGYAYANEIPIFGLCTDSSKPLSNMVEQSCTSVQGSLRDLLNELFASLNTVIPLPRA